MEKGHKKPRRPSDGYDFILERVEVFSGNGMISFIFQKDHSGYFYKNRLKVVRLVEKPPQMSNSVI